MIQFVSALFYVLTFAALREILFAFIRVHSRSLFCAFCAFSRLFRPSAYIRVHFTPENFGAAVRLSVFASIRVHSRLVFIRGSAFNREAFDILR